MIRPPVPMTETPSNSHDGAASPRYPTQAIANESTGLCLPYRCSASGLMLGLAARTRFQVSTIASFLDVRQPSRHWPTPRRGLGLPISGRDFPARAADAEGTPRIAEGRDRQVVAAHQGVWDKRGMRLSVRYSLTPVPKIRLARRGANRQDPFILKAVLTISCIRCGVRAASHLVGTARSEMGHSLQIVAR